MVLSLPIARTVALGAAVVAGALGLVACSSSASEGATATTAEASSSFALVAPAQAQAVLEADPAAVVLDVRTPEEFGQGRLAGAKLIDYQDPSFREAVGALDRDATYVVYCRSGNRSAGAVEVMRQLGFTDVTEVDGGIVAWEAAGLPVVTT